MDPGLFAIPLISAAAGWIIHKVAVAYIMNRYWPGKQEQLTQLAAQWAANSFSLSGIATKVSDPAMIEKAMPVIERHIDSFLNEKLQQEIPMLGMFIGNKTTDKIKEVFIQQLKDLFPAVMTEIVSNAGSSSEVEKYIKDRLLEISNRDEMTTIVSGQLKRLPVLGAIAGFIIGLLNLLGIWLMNSI